MKKLQHILLFSCESRLKIFAIPYVRRVELFSARNIFTVIKHGVKVIGFAITQKGILMKK